MVPDELSDRERELLEQLAEDAGGLAAFISRGDNFERQAKAFRRKLLRPAVTNLENEGFQRKPVEVLQVGDVMQDAALFFADFARPPDTCGELGEFALATVHRAENTDDLARLAA